MPSITAMTLNARGVAGAHTLRDLLVKFAEWAKSHGLAIICLQEHNLDPKNFSDHRRLAKAMGFTLEIVHGRADDVHSQRGGVLMVSYDEKVTRKKVKHSEPGLLRQLYDWNGKELDVVTVYAPANGAARDKFFDKVLRHHVGMNSLLCGDFNCVPDPTLDVVSRNPLAYDNAGARTLGEVVDACGLVDERREQLGDEIETTRGGSTRNGFTQSRLDRWYVPVGSEYQWTIQVENSFVFKENSSDHNPVTLKIEDRAGEVGSERVRINGNLLREAQVQHTVLVVLREAYDNRKSEVKKWNRAMSNIYKYLLKTTKERKRKTDKEIRFLHGQLEEFKWRHSKGRSTEGSRGAEKRIQRRLYEAQHPEVLEIPSEAHATFMYEKSGISSKAYFYTYKDRARKQHINSMKVNDWEEDKPVVFPATGLAWSRVEKHGKPDDELIYGKLKDILEAGETRISEATWKSIGIPKLTVNHWIQTSKGIFSPASATTTGDTKGVGTEFVKLFKMIFAQKHIDQHAAGVLLARLGRKQILDASRDALEADISEEECMETMEQLPEGKQAGPSRIPNEVFKKLARHFAPKMAAMLKEA